MGPISVPATQERGTPGPATTKGHPLVTDAPVLFVTRCSARSPLRSHPEIEGAHDQDRADPDQQRHPKRGKGIGDHDQDEGPVQSGDQGEKGVVVTLRKTFSRSRSSLGGKEGKTPGPPLPTRGEGFVRLSQEPENGARR